MSGLTEAQKARRLGKVTASTAAGLLGYLPYASPSQVWKAQMGIQPLKETLPMVMGNIYEPAILEATLHLLPLRGRFEKPDTCVHAKHPWLLCHPDGVLWDHKEMIQAKRHDGWLRDRYAAQGSECDNENVPLHELLQCQIELACWSSRQHEPHKWRVCWLAVDLGDANGPRLYRILKDNKLIAAMVERLRSFWFAYMQPNELVEPSDEGWVGNLNDPAATEKRWSDTKALFKMKLTPDDINAMPIAEVGK